MIVEVSTLSMHWNLFEYGDTCFASGILVSGFEFRFSLLGFPFPRCIYKPHHSVVPSSNLRELEDLGGQPCVCRK